jgi:O-antigen/teichoic acid export membrane protein
MFMLAEKLFKMASQLLVLVLMARVLAPEDLGQLMYCFALASIFLFLNQLGLDTLLVKKFIDQSIKRNSLLWHAFSGRLLAALLCVGLVNLLGVWLVEPEHRSLLFCISLYHLFLPFSTFEWFYQAEGRSDKAAIGLMSGQLVGLFVRLYAIFFNPALMLFAFAYVIEVAVIAVVYLLMASQDKITKPIHMSVKRIQKLTSESLPLMISGAVILLYMKIDQVMLGYLGTESEVAYYVAATRLSEAWYFVGLTVLSVYFPKVAAIKRLTGFDDFQQQFAKLIRVIVVLSIALVLLTLIFSDLLVRTLYGDSYSQSAIVLMITICCVPFVYLGAASTRLYLEFEDKKAVLIRAVLGLSVNVLLNLLLIPSYGAVGAATASLGAQITSSILSVFILKVNGKKVFLFYCQVLFPTFKRG